jgi:(R)-2-hydroxyacyl-CoA dehydratese activating ATPase
MKPSLSAGIDVGSATIKLVVLDNGRIERREAVPSASRPIERAGEVLRGLPAEIPLAATGYGRDLLAIDRDIPVISEIKAHALGARFLFPECRCVIDIGGQDVKVIALDDRGRVNRFEMNDRCAAGTGKFLEVMAQRLDVSLDAFCESALQGKDGVKISSLCAVFAESEIIGLLNRGCAVEDISRALHVSVVNRVKPMFARIEAQGPTAITGGGAKNIALVELFRAALNVNILVSEHSPLAGALGCAVSQGR